MKVFNKKKQKMALAIDRVMSFFLAPPKKQEWRCKNIVVFDFHLIGDIVLLTAFLKVLREKYIAADITLVCGSWGAIVLKNNPSIINRIIIYDAPWVTYEYSLKSIYDFCSVIKKVRRINADFGVEVRGDFRQILMMRLGNIKRIVGFSFTGGTSLLSDKVPDDGKNKHLIEYHKNIASYLNCSLEGFMPEVWFSQKEKNYIHHIQKKRKNKKIVGIHLGASNELRKLSISTASAMINQISSSKHHVVLFQGPGDDDLIKRVLKQINTPVEVVRASLRSYMVHIAACSIIICMDSGCGHLAAASGVPAIVVFGPQDPNISKPIGKDVTIVSAPDEKVPCRPCDQSGCSHEIYNFCMDSVTTEMILKRFLH